jgi:hypothetical protein
MSAEIDRAGKAAIIGGWIMGGLPALLLVLASVMDFVQPDAVVKGTVELGYPQSTIMPIGVALLISSLLYLIPQSAVLGAILLTGYLGGAVATHVRHGDPVLRMLVPVFFAVLLWGGLLLRERRLRRLLPLRCGS